MKNPLKSIYNRFWIWKDTFWINYWYKRDICPICHLPIEWEEESAHPAGPFYPYPVHKDPEQEDECEGVC